MAQTLDHEIVSIYPFTDEEVDQLCNNSVECVLMWATKDGWPVGVTHAFVWHDGKIWMTFASHRHRASAIRRDNRVSVNVSSHGYPAGPSEDLPGGAITFKGTGEFFDDDETKHWFYTALSQKLNPDGHAGEEDHVQRQNGRRAHGGYRGGGAARRAAGERSRAHEPGAQEARPRGALEPAVLKPPVEGVAAFGDAQYVQIEIGPGGLFQRVRELVAPVQDVGTLRYSPLAVAFFQLVQIAPAEHGVLQAAALGFAAPYRDAVAFGSGFVAVKLNHHAGAQMPAPGHGALVGHHRGHEVFPGAFEETEIHVGIRPEHGGSGCHATTGRVRLRRSFSFFTGEGVNGYGHAR